MSQVIESQQAIEEHQNAVGEGEIVLGVFTDFFELANRVIGEITNGARSERWQSSDLRGTMLPQQLFHDRQNAAFTQLTSPSALQQDVLAASPHLQVRPCSQKRVAPDLLAALYRFEQESVGLATGYSEKSRDRGQ